MEDIVKTVERLKFVFAKSMPRIPHYYTVKNEHNKEDYERLFHYIIDNGYYDKFFKKYYRYCNIGEYKYWVMSEDIEESIIINRRKIDESEFSRE